MPSDSNSDNLCLPKSICAFTICMVIGMLIALMASPASVEDYQLGKCVNTNTKDAGVCKVNIYTLSSMEKRKVSLKSACVLLPEPRIGVFYPCWRAGFSEDHRITFEPPKYDHHAENKRRAKKRNDNIILSLIIVSGMFAGVLVLACIVIGLRDCFVWCRRRRKYARINSVRVSIEPSGAPPPPITVVVDNAEDAPVPSFDDAVNNDDSPPPYQKS